MHQAYDDILDEMTRLIRTSHAETKEIGDGPSPECQDDIDPTTNQCRCVASRVPSGRGGLGPSQRASHGPTSSPACCGSGTSSGPGTPSGMPERSYT